MAEDIVDIKITMARNTENLERHMERTNQNETMITLLRAEMMPTVDHVKYVHKTFILLERAVKIIGGAVALAVALKTLGLFPF